jgi:hypothetical protein
LAHLEPDLIGEHHSVAERRADLARKLARKLDAAADAAADLPPDMRENVLNRLASRVGTLGIRLSDLGRREEALAASKEAVRQALRRSSHLNTLTMSVTLPPSGLLKIFGVGKGKLASVDYASKVVYPGAPSFWPAHTPRVAVMKDYSGSTPKISLTLCSPYAEKR